MIKRLAFFYGRKFSRVVVYMLQSVEYRGLSYLKWFWQTDDFSKVVYRRDLKLTRPSRMLLRAFRVGYSIEVLASLGLILWGLLNTGLAPVFVGFGLLIIAPILWAHLILLPVSLGRWLLIKPYYKIETMKSGKLFSNHPAIKIAVAGSYGKTTMKEILLEVLSHGKKVAATPANRNVAISHARFANSLNGDEDILIIEYGEGKPGDVAKFAKATHPDIGIITGLAPAHLDKYKTVEQAGQDIFSLADFIKKDKLYVNDQSSTIKKFIKSDFVTFNSQKVDDWKISKIHISITGTEFELKNGTKSLALKSKLIGDHQVGPLALAAVLADGFGLSAKQIQEGIAAIEPFEHRMRSYQLSGAWVIDDTYNGNIEGMKAGLALLKELPAKRKIYITPGLVDQGAKEKVIHQELGGLITQASPDMVILMKHSVTDYIINGMKDYKGQIITEDDPLNFYTNLDKFVASGDLVLMQNDWPDNYR